MSALRILVVHNRYQRPGGEDAVVDAEISLLRSRGHAVNTYLRDNLELCELNALGALAQTMWSRRTIRDITNAIRAFQPDIIHSHNTFAVISSSVYWAAWRAGVPVVQTLHNFRLLCVQAMFLRNGRVCEDCLGRVPWRGVARKCYRSSALQSATVATMLGMHRALGTYRDKVSRYIALTEFCRKKFVEGGLPESRVVVKPNFADIEKPRDGARSGGLYVGRLSGEKGIDTLSRAVREANGVNIDVIGSGPEEALVEANPRLRMMGWRASDEVYAKMRTASYLVMPSIWYENFPRTLIEAFAHGLPVIASRLGALAELITHGRTGLLFEPSSPHDLARQLAWAETFPEKMRVMGDNARKEYELKFSPAGNYSRLLEIYENAIAETRLRTAV